jgi:outer membrane protein
MSITRNLRHQILRFAAVAVVAASLACHATAETKLAVINLKTVFDGYWKTKQADVQLKERQGDLEKARKGLIEDYQKATEDYKKLLDSANDQAVSTDEKEKRKKSSESKLLEIRELEQNIQSFDRQMGEQLRTQTKRMRDNILREIREIVDKKAKSGSYNLVMDSAAESVNQTPIVLFTSGAPDLTEEVLNQLNANAPAGVPTGSEKPDEKSAEEKK